MKMRQSVGDAGPLSLYAEGFGENLEGRGYAPDSVRWRLRQLAALDRWLREHRLAAGDLDAACVDRLVAARRAEGRTTLVAVANFSVPISYLREIGVVPPEVSSQLDPVSQILERYRSYLVTQRGLVESSISVNLRVAESFCRKQALRLEELSAAEVTAYIVAFSARSSIGWSKKTVSALASFLRFLHVTGVTAQPLAAALPKLAGHRRTVPCELDESDFARLLGGCDCSRGIRFRVPSEATLRLVLERIDGDDLDQVLGRYLSDSNGDGGGRPVVAVDGKTVRGARAGQEPAPHLVCAVTHDGATVLGQCRTAEKSNEIPAVRRLLRGIDLVGAVITIDAMHTQETTARCLREQCRADYVMIVKANQPGLFARVKAQPWEQVPVVWQDGLERHHGREEQRSYKIITVPRGLRFPYAQQVVQITRRRRRIGTERWGVEVVYAICSLPCEQAPPKLLSAWIRGHWTIENKIHWCGT